MTEPREQPFPIELSADGTPTPVGPERSLSLPAHARLERRLMRRLLASGALQWPEIRQARDLQRRTGERLLRVLATLGYGDEATVTAAVADELGIRFEASPRGSREAAEAVPSAMCLARRILPLSVEDRTLVVAMADPLDERALDELSGVTDRDVRVVAAPRRAVDEELEELFAGECIDIAVNALRRERPGQSASSTLSLRQLAVLVAVAVALVASFTVAFVPVVAVLAALSVVVQVSGSGYRLALAASTATERSGTKIPDPETSGLDERHLPTYTLLVPLYGEAGLLPSLVDALSKLDYPKTKLDIKLLLEENDDETIAAARALDLGPPFQLLVVPDSGPKTKPKACNYGLLWARGDFVVIYDAEDLPDPDQLKKTVVAFRAAAHDVGCIQAKLGYWNREQNFLTRLFTAEYAHHFDLILPGLHAAHASIPLGGTSNHFPLGVLVSLGAWDPFNVTEDADLGIRLARAGLRTALIESTTFEEANSRLGNWTRQRSRWVKGYIQTWLVNMRHPLQLLHELGVKKWLSFQLILGGHVLVLLLNPLYWAIGALWALDAAGVVPSLLPGFVYLAACFNLVFGNLVYVYLDAAGLRRRGYDRLVKWAALAPAYWFLVSVGAWKGLLQLIRRPSYWEKTVHGLGHS